MLRFQTQKIFSSLFIKALISSSLPVVAVLMLGCNAMPEGEGVETGGVTQGLESTNGLDINGISTLGISTNGISTNGISTNGISTNGLNAAEFVTWFNVGSNGYGATIMKYIVRCAYPSGSSLAWTNPLTGTSYVWPGNLGLTPHWAAGNPATEVELQLISACLAAHVNRYGQEVEISILGRNSEGTAIPLGPTELTDFSVREGCFFGDLTTSLGVHSGSDRVSSSTESSLRACALSSQTPGAAGLCAPMVYEGSCSALNCVLDSTGTWYETCYLNGKAYRPLTTRVKPSVVYQCGDGVCQSTEQCGTGNTPDSCMADCGKCS